MDARRSLPLVLLVASQSACFLFGAEEDDGWPKEERSCFDPVRTSTPDRALSHDQWLVGDLDADTREDLLALDSQSYGEWSFSAFLATGTEDPFVDRDPVVVSTGIPLEEARMRLVDADADGDLDLVAYHTGVVVIVADPLAAEPTVTEHAIEVDWGRGAIVDFDDDGRVDFVARHGQGDNLVSYRGLPEGGFEVAGEAEFHEDIFCINQIFSHDRDGDWIAVQATRSCGEGAWADEVRVAMLEVADDGSFREVAAGRWSRDLFDSEVQIRALAQFAGGTVPQIEMLGAIYHAEDGELVDEGSVIGPGLRGDLNGDHRIDLVATTYDYEGVQVQFGPPLPGDELTIEWDLEGSVELVATADVDADGAQELIVTTPNRELVVLGPYDTCR